jgi:hypothetical protein
LRTANPLGDLTPNLSVSTATMPSETPNVTIVVETLTTTTISDESNGGMITEQTSVETQATLSEIISPQNATVMVDKTTATTIPDDIVGEKKVANSTAPSETPEAVNELSTLLNTSTNGNCIPTVFYTPVTPIAARAIESDSDTITPIKIRVEDDATVLTPETHDLTKDDETAKVSGEINALPQFTKLMKPLDNIKLSDREPYMATSIVELVIMLVEKEKNNSGDLLDGDYDFLSALSQAETKKLVQNLIGYSDLYASSKLLAHIVDIYRETLQKDLVKILDGQMPYAVIPGFPEVETFLKSNRVREVFTYNKTVANNLVKFDGIHVNYSIECTQSEYIKRKPVNVTVTKTAVYRGLAQNEIELSLRDISVFKI